MAPHTHRGHGGQNGQFPQMPSMPHTHPGQQRGGGQQQRQPRPFTPPPSNTLTSTHRPHHNGGGGGGGGGQNQGGGGGGQGPGGGGGGGGGQQGGGGGGAPPPPPTVPSGTPPAPLPTPPDIPTNGNPVFDYNGLLNQAHTWSSQAMNSMPLSGQFESGRRQLEDSLSSGLNQIGNQWSTLGPQNNLFLQRLATQQGLGQADVKEEMVGRGIYDSSITPYELSKLNADYDRQRQDQAFTMADQYRELSSGAAGVIQDYERGLIELLLQQAADEAANPGPGTDQTHGDVGGDDKGGGKDKGGKNDKDKDRRDKSKDKDKNKRRN